MVKPKKPSGSKARGAKTLLAAPIGKVLKPQVVAVDTNTLYHDDPKPAASPQFDKLWEGNKTLTEMTLVIPEVVRGELLYQQTTLALQSYRQAQNEAGTLGRITGANYPIEWREDVIRADVAKKIDGWIAAKGATVAPLVHEKIDYKEISRRAVWREPPFTGDPKAKEKGFRDALVLESVVTVFMADASDADLVFLTGDKQLQKAAIERLSGNSRVHYFPDADAFFGDLRLTLETQTRKFHNALQREATEGFRALVAAAIQLATEQLSPDGRTPAISRGTLAPTEPAGTWYVPDPPRATFVGKKDNRWLWRNRVQYSRKFRLVTPVVLSIGAPPGSASALSIGPVTVSGSAGGQEAGKQARLSWPSTYERILSRRTTAETPDVWNYQLSVDVSWSCLANEEGKIRDPRIDGVAIESEDSQQEGGGLTVWSSWGGWET